MRTTKPMLLNFFMLFCSEMGKKAYVHPDDLKSVKKWAADKWVEPCEIASYDTVGAWALDYAACYGGWCIKEIANESGGIRHPFGSRRYKPSELLDMMCFARECMSAYKRKV